MNERIQKLAEQAGLEFTYDPTEIPMRAFVEAWEGDFAKFAELIVLECANEILKWKSEPFPYDPEFGAKLIKEHFGVEQ
jgi:hypothetical protein